MSLAVRCCTAIKMSGSVVVPRRELENFPPRPSEASFPGNRTELAGHLAVMFAVGGAEARLDFADRVIAAVGNRDVALENVI
jgi:hypothetical protein